MSASPAFGPSEQRRPNRLIDETSPYLLQHAYNPVDWWPWGDEAIAAAKRLDRPIFLSVGYSACHWCHVMEHESFEDESIAALMNEHFINIKVDREERPDVDQIYMHAVQLLSGRGGWPMSVFLAPDLRPFFGGTYWPPESRMGMPGFRAILQRIHELWTTRRDELLANADQLTEAVREVSVPVGEAGSLNESLLRQASAQLRRAADRRHGGFGAAPKFPQAMDVRLLLRAWNRFGDQDALNVAQLTLAKMAAGGIYDHLGGGFHRYSTDERWLVPHFEKMLYDNALLVPAYLEAFQATGEANFARVARETLDYVLREMTHADGGFFSTQDADSEGEEGKFFVWTEAEVTSLLGPDDARVFNYCYDVTADGHWEGMSILNRPKTSDQAACVLGLNEADLNSMLDRSRRKLFEARSRRVAPGRDDKILTSWNGMMISAMSAGGQVLAEPRFAIAARSAADFVLTRMRMPSGELWHSFKDGQARFAGYLDDYACLINGLVDAYQVTFEARFVDAAVDLAERMISRFRDAAGGFFYTATDHEQLITQTKDSHDGATPSGNSMAATALLRLGRLCGRQDFETAATTTLEFVLGVLARSPTAASQSLLALDFLIGPACELAVVAGDSPQSATDVIRVLHQPFVPNKLIAFRAGGVSETDLPRPLTALLGGKASHGNDATVYVCEHGTCGSPLVGLEAVASRWP
jgi:hypothetical protein